MSGCHVLLPGGGQRPGSSGSGELPGSLAFRELEEWRERSQAGGLKTRGVSTSGNPMRVSVFFRAHEGRLLVLTRACWAEPDFTGMLIWVKTLMFIGMSIMDLSNLLPIG